MSRTETFAVRLAVLDGNRALREFQVVGEGGRRAMRQLEQGLRPNIPAVQQLGQGMDGLVQSLRGTASSIAVLHGPLGGIASRFNALATVITRTNVALAALAIGVAGVSFITVGSVRAFSEWERQALRTEQVIRATAGRFQGTLQDVEQITQALALNTLTSLQEARDAAAAALTFEGIDHTNLERTLTLAQDLSEVFGGDLRTNSALLARALEDPGRALASLARQGVVFRETQRDAIRELQRTGNIAGAAAVILKGVEESVGGAGGRAAGGLAGATDTMREQWRLLLEEMGRTFGVARLVERALQGIAGAFREMREIISKEAALPTSELLARQVEGMQETLRQLEQISAPIGPTAQRQDQLRETIAITREFVAVAAREEQRMAEIDRARRVRERQRFEEQQEAIRLGEAQALIDDATRDIEFEIRLIGMPEAQAEVEKLLRQQEITLPVDTSRLRAAFDARQTARIQEAADKLEEATRIELDLRDLTQVERSVEQAVSRLFQGIPEVELGVDFAGLREALTSKELADLEERLGKLVETRQFEVEVTNLSTVEEQIQRFLREADFGLEVDLDLEPVRRAASVELFRELQGELGDTTRQAERLGRQLQLLDDTRLEGLIDPADIGRLRALGEAAQEAAEQAKRLQASQMALREAFGDAWQEIETSVVGAASRSEDAWVGFVTGQKGALESLRDFAVGIFEDIARQATRFAIGSIFAGMAPGAGGGLAGALAGAFGRAGGGPVAAGQPYVVGERGPELFRPITSGTIVPNRVFDVGGFATGGGFRVPGTGQTDSQMILLRATPGEHLRVDRPGETGGEMHLRISVDVTGMTDRDEAIAAAVERRVTAAVRPMVRAETRDRTTRSREV